MKTPSRLWVLGPILATLGLALHGEAQPPVVERRTIGDTTFVRNVSGSVWGDSARLVEELSIGALDGDPHYTFSVITGVTAGPNGDIYVMDRAAGGGPVAAGPPTELRQYTGAGRFVRNIGRQGQGPGEFASPLGLTSAPNGDLLIYDAGTNRALVFDSAGTSRSAWTIPFGVNSTASRGLLADGSGGAYVPAARFLPDANGGRPTTQQLVAHFVPSGALTDTLLNPDCGHVAIPGPFQPFCQRAFHPSGRFLIGWNDTYSFELRAPGKPTLRIQREAPLERLQPAEEAEYRAQVAVARPSVTGRFSRTLPNGRTVMDSTLSPLPVMRTVKPAYRTLLAGLDGRIWVRVSVRAERTPPPLPDAARPPAGPSITWIEPLVYDVFEADGRYLGRIRMPPNASITAMRGDYVWGTRTGDLDEPYIVRWRIVHADNR